MCPVGERFQGSFYYAEEVSDMVRDSDIDSLTADAAQESRKPKLDPRTALADEIERAIEKAMDLPLTLSSEHLSTFAAIVAGEVAERSYVIVNEPMLAAAMRRLDWFSIPDECAADLFAALARTATDG
jgi:hypothetical protein